MNAARISRRMRDGIYTECPVPARTRPATRSEEHSLFVPSYVAYAPTGERGALIDCVDVDSMRDTDSLLHICTSHCLPGQPVECVAGCVSLCGRKMRPGLPKREGAWLPNDCIVCSSLWEAVS